MASINNIMDRRRRLSNDWWLDLWLTDACLHSLLSLIIWESSWTSDIVWWPLKNSNACRQSFNSLLTTATDDHDLSLWLNPHLLQTWHHDHSWWFNLSANFATSFCANAIIKLKGGKDQRFEMIIRENVPEELPPDVVRSEYILRIIFT